MAAWDPWRGCHKKSEGCMHCYIHRANAVKGINTDIVYKTDDFYKPIQKDKKGNFKMKSGQTVFVCFRSDFWVEEADEWRREAWEIMRLRKDLHFFFITKRIERFDIGLPEDFSESFDHVSVCVTMENQQRVNERLPILKTIPLKHKSISIQPMLEKINLEPMLDSSIDLVVVGGESGSGVRPLDYSWVLDVREQCIKNNVNFEFRQVGSIFIKDDITYHIKKQYLCSQARKAEIDWIPIDN